MPLPAWSAMFCPVRPLILSQRVIPVTSSPVSRSCLLVAALSLLLYGLSVWLTGLSQL